MGDFVPVNAVFGTAMNQLVKVVVKIEKVELEFVDDERGVLVGLEHVLAQLRLGALDLGHHEAAAHVLRHGHGRRPQEDGVGRQPLDEREDAHRQVLLVLVYAVRAIACQVPAAAVHYHNVGLLALVLDVLAYRDQVVRIAASDEVESDQMLRRLVFSHLSFHHYFHHQYI